MKTYIPNAVESLDEIERIFTGTRGFPEEKPSAPCLDLCGSVMCDEHGCVFAKTDAIRLVLTGILKAEPTETLSVQRPDPLSRHGH